MMWGESEVTLRYAKKFTIKLIKPFGEAIVQFKKGNIEWIPTIYHGASFDFPELPRFLGVKEVIDKLRTYDSPWYNRIELITVDDKRISA